MWSAQGQSFQSRGWGKARTTAIDKRKIRFSVVMHFPQTRPKRAYSLPLAWNIRCANAAGIRGDLPGSWTEHGAMKIKTRLGNY